MPREISPSKFSNFDLDKLIRGHNNVGGEANSGNSFSYKKIEVTNEQLI